MRTIACITIILLGHLSASAQWCASCSPYLFPFEFEYMPVKTFQPIKVQFTGKDTMYPTAPKITAADYYLHNGNDWRGVEDIFATNIVPGSGWLKTFDFGTFASLIFEIKSENPDNPSAGFEWTGKLGFLKLFKRKPIIRNKHKSDIDLQDDSPHLQAE